MSGYQAGNVIYGLITVIPLQRIAPLLLIVLKDKRLSLSICASYQLKLSEIDKRLLIVTSFTGSKRFQQPNPPKSAPNPLGNCISIANTPAENIPLIERVCASGTSNDLSPLLTLRQI